MDFDLSPGGGHLNIAGSVAVAAALLILHVQTTKSDLTSGLKQMADALEAWKKADACLSPMAARVERELGRMRLEIFMTFVRICIHVVAPVLLYTVVDFLITPTVTSGAWMLFMLATYTSHVLLCTGRLRLTNEIFRKLRVFFWVSNVVLAFASGTAGKDGSLGRLGQIFGGQILQAFVFPAGAATVAHSICHAAAYTWSLGQMYSAVDMWLVSLHMILQMLVCIAVPLFFEFSLRERAADSFRSQDSDSLICGFRQMLKGTCDGELLLDCDFRISGSAPCLQRLLGGTEDYSSRSFRELVDGEEARERFDIFMTPETEEGDDARARCVEGAPRCLRVPLQARSGRSVSVDVFHVRLPPSLYGADTTYHLIAMAEDIDSRAHPEADSEIQEALPSSLLASSSKLMAQSAASSETQAEGYEELVEMTLLLDASTELLDIEEAHLRFMRHTNEAEVRTGMPTLKRFARPLDWCGIDTALRRYARQVRKAHSRGQAAQRQALPPLMFRMPGEPRKHVLSRSITVSSPFERKERDEPVFLYLHLTDFYGRPRPAACRRLEGLYEEQTLPQSPPRGQVPLKDQSPESSPRRD